MLLFISINIVVIIVVLNPPLLPNVLASPRLRMELVDLSLELLLITFLLAFIARQVSGFSECCF